MQVQRPEELEGRLAELQRQVEALSAEASQSEQLREGRQSLLSANQRMSRQLAELQKTLPGECSGKRAGCAWRSACFWVC